MPVPDIIGDNPIEQNVIRCVVDFSINNTGQIVVNIKLSKILMAGVNVLNQYSDTGDVGEFYIRCMVSTSGNLKRHVLRSKCVLIVMCTLTVLRVGCAPLVVRATSRVCPPHLQRPI